MTAASGKADGGADMWFRVEVMDGNGQIVAIESESLAGRDIGESEEETIKKSILNLCGFIGWHPESVPTPAANGPGEAVSNAPERIYLQDGIDKDDAENGIVAASVYDRAEGITWCKDAINSNDTAYVRADLATPQPGMVTVPREYAEAVANYLKHLRKNSGDDVSMRDWLIKGLDAALRSGGREEKQQ